MNEKIGMRLDYHLWNERSGNFFNFLTTKKLGEYET